MFQGPQNPGFLQEKGYFPKKGLARIAFLALGSYESLEGLER